MTNQKRPYGTNAKRRSVTITEPDWQKLKALGNGNASAGIRQALRQTGVKPYAGTGTRRQQVEGCTSATCPLYDIRPTSSGDKQ